MTAIGSFDQVDTAAVEELARIRGQREIVEGWLAKVEERRQTVSPEVCEKVSRDYRSRISSLESDSRVPLESAHAEYGKLLDLYRETQARLEEAGLEEDEVELRNELGEFELLEYKERKKECRRRVEQRQAELASGEKLKAMFLSAFPFEEGAPPAPGSAGDPPAAPSPPWAKPATDAPADDPPPEDPSDREPAAEAARSEVPDEAPDKTRDEARDETLTGRIAPPPGDLASPPAEEESPLTLEEELAAALEGKPSAPGVAVEATSLMPRDQMGGELPSPPPSPGEPANDGPPPALGDLPAPDATSMIPREELAIFADPAPPEPAGESSAAAEGDGEPPPGGTMMLPKEGVEAQSGSHTMVVPVPGGPSPRPGPGEADAAEAVGMVLVAVSDDREEEYPVHPGGCVIGASADCDVVVAGDDVASRHAELSPAAGGCILRDLESPFGTRVNGQKVHEILLQDSDRIQIGGVELRFRRLSR